MDWALKLQDPDHALGVCKSLLKMCERIIPNRKAEVLCCLGQCYFIFQERPLEKLCNISGSPHGALRKPLCGLGPKSFSVRQRQLSINWIWHRYETV